MGGGRRRSRKPKTELGFGSEKEEIGKLGFAKKPTSRRHSISIPRNSMPLPCPRTFRTVLPLPVLDGPLESAFEKLSL